MRRTGALLTAATVLAACALAAAGTALAAPKAPPHVAEEVLQATSSQFTCVCDPLGVSTVSFDVSGAVTGEHAGTFDEVGTATMAGGRLLDFHSTFDIRGLGFHISGERTATAAELAASSAFSGEVLWGHPNGLLLHLQTDYSASVTGRYGSGTDSGTADLTYGDVGTRDVAPGMTAFEFLVVP